MRRGWGLPLVLPLIACRSTIYDAVDPVVQLETPVVWVGAQVVLTSSALSGADTLPVLVLGGDTISGRYAAPDSLVFPAPSAPGTWTVYVGFRGRGLLPVGDVTVGGRYVGYRDVPLVGGQPLRWPGGAVPSFLIALPNALGLVDARSGTTVSQLPDSAFSQSCNNGPGPAPDGRVVVSRRLPSGACGPLVALRPDDLAMPADTGPTASGCRLGAELGPARWLVLCHHMVQSLSRDSSGGWASVSFQLGEPYDLAVSPRGDRAVPIGAEARVTKLPVFTPTSPTPAYLVPPFFEAWGAEFSEDGDTLYLAGDTDSTEYVHGLLAAVRASDGTVLRSAAWPTDAYLMVLDHARPWMYFVGYAPGPTGPIPELRVYDRSTLSLVTRLSVPQEAVDRWMVLYPLLDVLARRLYVLETCGWCAAGGYSRIYAFDLVP